MASSEFPRVGATGTRCGSNLVGTHGFEVASRAIDVAAGLGAELDTDLWIAQVIDGSSATGVTQFAHAEKVSIGDATQAAVRDILFEAARRAVSIGARKPHTVLRWGASAEELVAATGEVRAKAILVGRRGRWAQALMGSISQKPAGISPVNLVIVP